MIVSLKNRKTVQAAWVLIGIGVFVSSSYAQPAAGEKPLAKIQGETIDAAVVQSVTNPPSAMTAKIGTSATNGPATGGTNTNASQTESLPLRGGYLVVDFDKLASFDFDPPSSSTNHVGASDEANDLIPKNVKALDKKKVMLRGFMMPVVMDADSNTTEFFITRNPMCCAFGMLPKLNELVTVEVDGKGLEPKMGEPVTVKGTLHVGAIRDNGDVTGVYQMDGEALVDQ